MRDKKGGFPSFLRNKFVGNSREQLLIGLEHANVLTQQEIREAVHLSQLIPEITPKLWRVTCDMEVKLCGASLVCVGVWFGRAVELEIIITAWVLAINCGFRAHDPLLNLSYVFGGGRKCSRTAWVSHQYWWKSSYAELVACVCGWLHKFLNWEKRKNSGL